MFLSVRHDIDMLKHALKIDDLAEEFLRCPDRHGTGSEKDVQTAAENRNQQNEPNKMKPIELNDMVK